MMVPGQRLRFIRQRKRSHKIGNRQQLAPVPVNPLTGPMVLALRANPVITGERMPLTSGLSEFQYVMKHPGGYGS